MKKSALRFAPVVSLLAYALLSTHAAAADSWTFPVINTVDGKESKGTWIPIDPAKVSKPWNICALFPHMKDPYWLAANYGIVTEAKRDKVGVTTYQAGGYSNLSTQLNQMDNCINQGADAIILGSISADGVSASVRKAVAKGIPVIDFVNGVNEPLTSGHALVSFHDLALTTAQYMVAHFSGQKLKVGLFPGPQGAGWSDAAVEGFKEGLKGSDIELMEVKRGDMGMSVQLNLIQNAMQAYPDMNFIVGADIAAQAAAVAVRNAHKEAAIKVMAFDIIPGVYADIEAGRTLGSPTDFTVMQGKMALDMAVRLLEKQELPAKRSGPEPTMVTLETMKNLKWETMFAPKDYQAEFEVKAP